MKAAPIGPNEQERLQALLDYEVLDTVSELPYEDIALLASKICGVPIALVSLIDAERQWFKARHGIDASETPREISFCGHAIHGSEVFQVEDALKDARFSDNPLVTGAPNVRFYAGAPLITPGGHAIGTLCVIDDEPHALSSEQQQALMALSRQVVRLLELRKAERINHESFRELQELTRSLKEQQDKLIYSAKMASLGQMASGIAHEINNPLSIILGKVWRLQEAVKAGSLSAETALPALESIERTARRIEKIVRGLRSFAREGSKDPVEITSADALIDDALTLSQERIRNTGIALDRGQTGNIQIKARTTQALQILLNLIGNALDAAHAGQGAEKWIRIECKVAGEFAEIRVIDSGSGVPKEIREKIMEPFFTTKPVGAGTGLGLSISKGLAEANGGTLELDPDQPNTTFILRLPLHR